MEVISVPVIIVLTLNQHKMKKILLLVAICATTIVQQSFAQNNATPTPSDLLTSYINIKDALVSGNANNAANSAATFVKTIKSIGSDIVNETNKKALLEDVDLLGHEGGRHRCSVLLK